MNKNTTIGVIIVIVVLILIGWGMYSYQPTPPVVALPADNTTTTTTQNTTTATGTTAPKTGVTFRSIFQQSGSHVCTFEQVSASSRSSSAVYIADGKMRGEFRTTTGAITTGDLMVYNGGTLYTWKEGTGTGKKSSITSISQLPEVIPTDLTSGAVYGTSANNVSWDCHDWKQDNTLLAPPTTVKFS